MATIAYDADGPGKGAFSPALMQGSRTRKLVTGTFTFDATYPAGGEDITDIFNQFAELKGIWMQSPSLSAGTGKHVHIDYANKKAQLLTNAAAPVDVGATDQSGAGTLRFMAWGM